MSAEYAFLFLLVPACIGYAALGAVAVQWRAEARARSLSSFLLLLALWLLGAIVEILAPNLLVFNLSRVITYAAAGFVPIALLAFCYGALGRPLGTHSLVLLALIPAVTVLLTATNPWHEAMWPHPPLTPEGRFDTEPHWGPWFLFVHAPYSYGMVAGTLAVFALQLPKIPRSQRPPLATLVFAGVGPLIASVFGSMHLGLEHVSTTAAAFAIFFPVYAWVVLGLRVDRYTPLAYATVFEQIGDPVITLDNDERVVSANAAAAGLLRVPAERLIGRPLPPESALGGAIHRSNRQPQSITSATRRHYEVRSFDIVAENGEPRGRTVICRDVSRRHAAQEELRRNEQLLRTLIDHSLNGIVRLRRMPEEEPPRFRCLFANHAAGRFLGLDPEEMPERTAEELLGKMLERWQVRDAERLLERFNRDSADGRQTDVEIRLTAARHEHWVRVIGEPVGHDVALTFIDITERKRREREMEDYALRDALTGVLNRRGFERAAARLLPGAGPAGAKQAAARADGGGERHGAFAFIDLNGFKQVNDTLGHQMGDELLQSVTARLRENLRPEDVIGRVGGDEFIVLAPTLDEQSALRMASRLTRAMAQKYEIDVEIVDCPASIGLAIYPRDGISLPALMRRADRAMYQAKRRSRDATVLNPTLLMQEVELITGNHRALDEEDEPAAGGGDSSAATM